MWSGWFGMQWRQSFWTGTYFATLSWWNYVLYQPFHDIGLPKPVTSFFAGF